MLIIDHVYDQVLKGLSGEDMTYQPLLPPDDEADVVEQVDCLAEWSKGFLDGIGASGKLQGNKLAEDVTEVLRDLDAFSNATIEDPKVSSRPARFAWSVVARAKFPPPDSPDITMAEIPSCSRRAFVHCRALSQSFNPAGKG